MCWGVGRGEKSRGVGREWRGVVRGEKSGGGGGGGGVGGDRRGDSG